MGEKFMNNKKQKIALFTVGLLMVVAIVSGLVLPYLQNRNIDTVSPGRLQQEQKIPVPDFQFTDADGNTLSFENFKGKPIVINFWGTWCPWCVVEMGDFNKAAGEYGDDVNFIFLDADDTVEDVQNFLADNQYDNITSYFDSLGHGSYVFGVSSFPTTIYVDADGNLYDAAIGRTNYDSITSIVDAMLGK